MNSTNADMDLSAALASKAVARVAGPSLTKDCESRRKACGQLKEGDVFITRGHNLPSSLVFHVICPNDSKVN